jgi:hypothetical protein
MAGKYFVHIEKDGTAYGPYSLKSAKDFARIGSQHGSARAVTRGLEGPRVRLYAEGVRRWPTTARQCRGLTVGEQPRALGERNIGKSGLQQVLVMSGSRRGRLLLVPKGQDPDDPDFWAEVSLGDLPLKQHERVRIARGGAVMGVVDGEWFDAQVEETLNRAGVGHGGLYVENGAHNGR